MSQTEEVLVEAETDEKLHSVGLFVLVVSALRLFVEEVLVVGISIVGVIDENATAERLLA